MAEAIDGLSAGGATPDMAVRGIAPVEAGERISTLDFIRGIAVMGILAANIVAFGQPFDAYMYPTAFLTDPADPGGWMWIAQFILIDGKMRGLFTVLFGAGLYLFMERAWASGATRKLQAWRLIILMLFGMVHYYLIWPGDILFFYAVFGLAALPLMRMTTARQMILGLVTYAAGALFYLVVMSMPWAIADTAFGERPQLAEAREGLQGGVEATLAQSAQYTALMQSSDYPGLVIYRLTELSGQQLTNVLLFAFETLPLIIIGMALYRLGFFSGEFDPRRMKLWGWLGIIGGGLAHLAIGLAVKAGGFTYYGTLAGFVAWTPLPRLAMVLGLAALLVVYSPAATGWLAERVRAAGRAAFTNYLGTSLVMTAVFSGWGLGLFGELNRPQLYLVVALTCVLMLAWSKPWLDRFRYGPLEWLWRCLTYRRVFPLKR